MCKAAQPPGCPSWVAPALMAGPEDMEGEWLGLGPHYPTKGLH